MIIDGWNEQSANEMAEYLDLYAHEVAANLVEFIKGKSEKVTNHLWYVADECLEDVERFLSPLTTSSATPPAIGEISNQDITMTETKRSTQYTCKYISGGGTKYSDGVWTIKETSKTITVEKISELNGHSGVYAMHEVGFKTKIGKNTAHPFEGWDDGTFTIYLGRAGTPYYFEPIK